jgi:hypothetical protein
MARKATKARPHEQRSKSFRSQVVSLGTPMLRRFAEEVESSLGVVVNRAVRDFFDRSRPGVGEVSPGVRPGSCPDFISGTNYGFRTYGPDDGGPASPPKPADEQGGTAAREPVGFRRMGCVSNAGWFVMKKIGNVLHGTLEGMYEHRDDLRPEGRINFFQIKLMQPCEVRMGTGEAARVVEAKVGDIVNVHCGPKTKLLEPLIPLLARGAEFEVWGKEAPWYWRQVR